jgi:hypothetical protein
VPCCLCFPYSMWNQKNLDLWNVLPKDPIPVLSYCIIFLLSLLVFQSPFFCELLFSCVMFHILTVYCHLTLLCKSGYYVPQYQATDGDCSWCPHTKSVQLPYTWH